MRKLVLLRPEPGLTESAARARALGLEVLACPLFRAEPTKWSAPEARLYDALLMTSANAARHGGPELARLINLPVQAVGEATAKAAREAGFRVDRIGSSGVAELLSGLPNDMRLLHLAGADHVEFSDPRIERRIVYQSAQIDQPGPLPIEGAVVAVHSARAGARLEQLASGKGSTVVAAISMAAAESSGPGWERVEVADSPNDNSLLALAAMLCHISQPE